MRACTLAWIGICSFALASVIRCNISLSIWAACASSGAAKSFSGGAQTLSGTCQDHEEARQLRYPPGYVYYGLDTYEKLFLQTTERWTPRFLMAHPPGFEDSFLSGPLLIDRTYREAQGYYSDGWAGVGAE